MVDSINEQDLLQLIKKMDAEMDSHQQDGSVKVENNKITVKDPGPNGVSPTIRCMHPVVIKKNGIQIFNQVVVESSDIIRWEILSNQLFKIDVTEDKMEAYLHVLSKNRYAWNLKDTPETTRIMIEAEEDQGILLGSLQLTDVTLELQKLGITKNIKTSAILQEILAPTFKPILIACGIHPVHGQDAQLHLYFQDTIESRYSEINGSIDFRNHLKIPTVKKDDVIAQKNPGKPGIAGYNVYGEIVYPPEPLDIVIAAKDHVSITPDGQVIALKEGRPRLTGTHVRYFDICTSYFVAGDVNLKTGNIVFSGDILVYGNVTENMTLESLGNVYVQGNVYHATITAAGSIKINGIAIGSTLNSGYFGVIFNRLNTNMKCLSELLLSLDHSTKLLIDTLEERKQHVEFSILLTALIKTKFQELPKKAREITRNIENIQRLSLGELNDLKEKMVQLSSPALFYEIKSFDMLRAITNFISDNMFERMQETVADIDMLQCHLGNIKSNGDTYIRGKGTMQSEIYSKGNVIFFEADSVCRGTKVECGGMISAMIVDGETHLKAGSRIILEKMTSGKVCVGRCAKEILETVHQVTFEISEKRLVMKYKENHL